MAGLVLDSSVCIRAEREKQTPAEFLLSLRNFTKGDRVGLSSVGVTELFRGVYRAESPIRAERRREFLEVPLGRLPVFDFTLEIAELAGRVDGQEAAKGNVIPFGDLLIGATALFHGYSLLTVYVRHFRLIPGLEVIPF